MAFEFFGRKEPNFARRAEEFTSGTRLGNVAMGVQSPIDAWGNFSYAPSPNGRHNGDNSDAVTHAKVYDEYTVCGGGTFGCVQGVKWI